MTPDAGVLLIALLLVAIEVFLGIAIAVERITKRLQQPAPYEDRSRGTRR